MITRDEVLMGRDKTDPLTPEMEANLTKLLKALNAFRTTYGKPMHVSSGYRPPSVNAKIPNAAKKSNHMVCLAADFKDPDGSLDQWCLANPKVLEKAGLWQEHPDATPGWCHLQAVAPKSGNRVFRP